MHERAALVHHELREGHAEADRQDRSPPLLQPVRRVVRIYLRAELLPSRQLEGSADAARGAAVFDRLAEVEAVALGEEVPEPQLDGVPAALPRGRVEGRLDHEDALRGAEAAEGGEGREVRAAHAPGDPEVGNMVGARRVKERPGEDGRGEVAAGPRVLVVVGLEGEYPALGVQAEAVIARVGMALAGPVHVLAALQVDLHRPPRARGAEGGEGGPLRGLVFLAAEASAQAPGLHLDVVHRQPQDAGYRALHSGRSLGAGEHEEPAAPLRLGHRPLRLEIDVLLASRVDAALDHDRATRERGGDVARAHRSGGLDVVARGVGLPGIEDRLQLLVVQLDEGGGLPREARALGQDEGYALA